MGRGLGELSVLFAQFFGKPKTTLENGHRLGVVLCLARVKSGVGLERTMYPRHTHPLPSKLPFFKRFFFLIWAIFKVFIEFVTILHVSCFGFLPERRVGSQLPNQESNPYTLQWKVKSKPLDCQGGPLTNLKHIQIGGKSLI